MTVGKLIKELEKHPKRYKVMIKLGYDVLDIDRVWKYDWKGTNNRLDLSNKDLNSIFIS